MSRYIFDNSTENGAHRLHRIEHANDPYTFAQLDKIGIASGWRCLEIGAGNGSVATWMAQRVGAKGSVLATDIDLRFLAQMPRRDTVEVRQHDITADHLPNEAFDLIHARHVFVHLPDPVPAMMRLTTALKPGGWLVIEEIDQIIDRTLLMTDRCAAAAIERVTDATWELFAKHGTGRKWGRHLPIILQRMGLDEIGVDVHVEMARGGSQYADWSRLSYERNRAEAIAAGLAIGADYETALAALSDPSTMLYTHPFFSARGRRAPLS